MAYYKNKAVVLTYHNVSEEPFSIITVSPRRLGEDLEMLRDCGFNIISFKELTDALKGTSALPDNAVVITFDDGLRGVYDHAYPLLKSYGMQAVCFVITSRCEVFANKINNLEYVDKNSIRKMYESGIMDIQSHSHNCHMLIKNRFGFERSSLVFRNYYKVSGKYESKRDYSIRVTEDLNKSKNIIYECTENFPDTLCLPFGHYNNDVLDIAEKCGYKYFVSCHYGYNTFNSGDKIIRRINAGVDYLTSDKLKEMIINCARIGKLGSISNRYRLLKRKLCKAKYRCI